MILEVPSKTFVLGEYLALRGSLSLVVSTGPSFRFQLSTNPGEKFHLESPAGQLLENTQYQLKIEDPHNGNGGFGRSTAEYLVALYYLSVKKSKKDFSIFKEELLFDLQDLVNTYQDHAGKNYRPSGADLVAQIKGGLCWYDGMNYRAESHTWPFPDYEFLIFRTGRKLNTHEHLSSLGNKDLSSLIPTMLAARTSFEGKNLKIFCESINYYNDQLAEMGLADLDVREIAATLRAEDYVLAAKGCGAMGIDTVLTIGLEEDRASIISQAESLNLDFVTSLQDLHGGLREIEGDL